MDKPTYQHTCKDCQFLGNYNSSQYGVMDLYYCGGPAASTGGSILARYGDEDYEYGSMPVRGIDWADEILKEGVPELFTAFQLADEKGLIKQGENMNNNIIAQNKRQKKKVMKQEEIEWKEEEEKIDKELAEKYGDDEDIEEEDEEEEEEELSLLEQIKETHNLDDSTAQMVAEFCEEEDYTADDIEVDEGKSYIEITVGTSKSYKLFTSMEDAERYAIDYVKDMIESDPDTFSPDFIQSHVYMTETDIRMTASDLADSRIEGMRDSDILEEADMEENSEERDNLESELSDLEDGLEDLESELEDIEDELRDLEDDEDVDKDEVHDKKVERENKLDEIKEKKENIVAKQTEIDELPDEDDVLEDAREQLREKIYDEIKEELDSDPVSYFIDQEGMYSEVSELIENHIVMINYNEAAEEAVNVDGVAHFLSGYDGNEYELPSGGVYYRD